MTGITKVREYGKDMWLVDAEKLYDDLANNLRWIMGDGSNGKDLDTYAYVGNTIRETFNEQAEYQVWTPISEKFPEVGQYVLVSFENEGLTLPHIASYEEDEDGDCAFYPDGSNFTYASVGVFVNAWMPLPEVYREKQ